MIIDPVSYPNLFHVLRPTSRFTIERRKKYFYWLVSFKPKKVFIFNSNLIYQQFHLQFESNLFYSNFIWFFISFYFPNLVKIIFICEYIRKNSVCSQLIKALFLSGMFSIIWKFVRQRCFADWQPDPDSGGSVVHFIFIFFVFVF